jgi:high-affinity nickel-transport protein
MAQGAWPSGSWSGAVLTAAALGFALGLRHAADPDHVAAIAALVARHRSARSAAWIGAAWGLGHTLMILAAGGAFVALRISVMPRWALASELVVAGILLVLGASNLRTVWRGTGARDLLRGRVACRTTLRSVGVGMAHGLAGSAAIAILALAAVPGQGAALLYLLVFGLGTVGGMVAMSFGLGAPVRLAGDRPRVARWVLAGSGVLSIAVGIHLAVEVGVATHVL